MPRPKVPPLTRLQDALEASEFDANPLKESFNEDQKTILKLIVDMTSHITTEKALRALKKMRMGSPELFLNPETFLAALKLLEMYRFKLMIRRFIYEIFGECIISHQDFRNIWDADGDNRVALSPPGGSKTVASPRRVGLKKDLKDASARRSPGRAALEAASASASAAAGSDVKRISSPRSAAPPPAASGEWP